VSLCVHRVVCGLRIVVCCCVCCCVLLCVLCVPDGVTSYQDAAHMSYTPQSRCYVTNHDMVRTKGEFVRS
jgi:hypothetical protein